MIHLIRWTKEEAVAVLEPGEVDQCKRGYQGEPMPSAEQYRKALAPFSKYVMRSKLKILRPYISKQWHGYDIGAGLGQYARALNAEGYNVWPVEPLPGYGGGVKKRAEELTDYADYAYLFNVLHHSDNPVKMLEHLRGVTGRIIISEINQANPLVRLFINIFLPWEDPDGHLTGDEVAYYLKSSGWVIRERFSSPFFGIPKAYNWFICEPS